MRTASAVLFCFLLTSCSDRLVGTRTVQKYETMIPSQQTISLTNIGTITFNKDYSGAKDVHYAVMGTQRDNTGGFKWSYTKSYVTIQADDSDFAKTWLIKDDSKSMQRWQSTNGRGQIQTMELVRWQQAATECTS